jgi:hypothetical protein
MAGKQCPSCKAMTFFKTPTGRKCSKCGLVATTPANNGRGGRGDKCSICGELTVFETDTKKGVKKCRTCGTEYILPRNK